MPQFTDADLSSILEAGESAHVEFKASVSDAAGIREAICAFANDLPGRGRPGLLFVGVQDDATLGDAKITDRLLRQLADMKTDGNIVPPPALTVEKRVLHGKEVALVTVHPSDSPPVRCRGAIHVRSGPRRGIATAQDERILNERRRHGDRPFDLQPIPTAGVSDLDLTLFENQYLPQAFSDEVLAANDRSLHERLAATKMIVAADQPTATVLGLLTLGKAPQDFLPGAYVQFLRIAGREQADDVIDSEEIRGAMPDVLRRIDDKLTAHNRTAVEIVTGTVDRRRVLYPLEALQQIVWNAVMHRTYEATHAPVHLYWFDDRIEVTNPGGVFGAVTPENFGQSGAVDYRNPNLAEVMKTFGYVQRFGVGLSIARRLLRAAGHPDPEFEFPENFVRATIKRPRHSEWIA